MRKTFFVTLVALFVSLANVMAEESDTVRVYFIDGEMVKNFTGKELVGKTIYSYDIRHTPFSLEGTGKWQVLERHRIVTKKLTANDGAASGNEAKSPLVIVDGEAYGGSLSAIASDDIKSVDVIKDPRVCALYTDIPKYGDRAKNGVIRVVTKKQSADPLVYIVDGKVSTASEAKKIPAERIKSMVIHKEGVANKYSEVCGKDVAIIEINTK